MKIRRFNENIEENHIDIDEVCPKCGSIAMYLTDHQSLYMPEKYDKDQINIDNEVYADIRCDNCGYKESIIGDIKWRTKEIGKRKEYIEMHKKGISPVEIQKYNL